MRPGLRRRLPRRRLRRPQGPGLGGPGRGPHRSTPTSTSRPTTSACAATPPPTSLARWRTECPPRWKGRSEQRLVRQRRHQRRRLRHRRTARSRLNLANILDDAAATGIGAFVVGAAAHPRRRASTAGSRCSSRPRPTSAPAAACPSSTATARSPATTSGAPTSARAGDGVHPGQAGYGLIAWLVLHNGWGRLAAPACLTLRRRRPACVPGQVGCRPHPLPRRNAI